MLQVLPEQGSELIGNRQDRRFSCLLQQRLQRVRPQVEFLHRRQECVLPAVREQGGREFLPAVIAMPVPDAEAVEETAVRLSHQARQHGLGIAIRQITRPVVGVDEFLRVMHQHLRDPLVLLICRSASEGSWMKSGSSSRHRDGQA